MSNFNDDQNDPEVVEKKTQPDRTNQTDQPHHERTIRDLVNSPLKKFMFAIQVLSYVLIVGSPLIGGVIGKILGLKTSQTGGLILGIFIAGEVLFYGSLAFLGKEIVLIVRDKVKMWFKKKDGKSKQAE